MNETTLQTVFDGTPVLVAYLFGSHSELAASLQQAVGFRNILVRQYMNIDYNLVYDALHGELGQLEAFLSAVSAFVQARS